MFDLWLMRLVFFIKLPESQQNKFVVLKPRQLYYCVHTYFQKEFSPLALSYKNCILNIFLFFKAEMTIKGPTDNWKMLNLAIRTLEIYRNWWTFCPILTCQVPSINYVITFRGVGGPEKYNIFLLLVLILQLLEGKGGSELTFACFYYYILQKGVKMPENVLT